MSPSTIIREAAADRVDLVVSPAGGIKARGPQGAVTLWKPIIRDNKRGIVAALREAANEPALSTQLQQLIRKVGAFRRFTPAELEETLAIASRDPDHALVSFRLLAAEVHAIVDIDREGFEERAGILDYEGGCFRGGGRTAGSLGDHAGPLPAPYRAGVAGAVCTRAASCG